MRARGFHYGWVIVGVGVVVSMAVLGLARFAFGMVLPSMQRALDLSYEQMGWIGTSNFLGYLLGASSSGALTARWGPRRVIVAALALITVALAWVSIASGFGMVLLAFTVTGLGSGAGNVAMVGLVSRWFLRSMRGWAAGLVVGGIGLGLMLAGLLVPAVNVSAGALDGWRVSWRILAAVIAVVVVIAAVLLRDNPSEVGLSAAGHPIRDAVVPEPVSLPEQRRTTIRLGLIYAMYGFSYAIYATFIVTTLVRERGIAEGSAGLIWAVVGFLSLFCSLFGALSDRVGRKLGLATVFGLQAVAFLIVGLQLPGGLVYLSVFLFGICAWSVPGIMGATAGDYMPPEQAIKALGALTVFFGIGQAAGPAIAGILAERTGQFAIGYLLAAAAAVLGAAGSLAMRQPGTHAAPHPTPTGSPAADR
ncbi:MAG: YbfB/YjiJ family MFS transporter [Austwickia sp.]|nr:YbfB/YjiJ family MFS transporter [Austwickia sp.]